MTPINNTTNKRNPGDSRRLFLSNSLKLAALSSMLLPLQKAFGNGVDLIIGHTQKPGQSIRNTIFGNNLILNTKTKIVHLPTEKIFSKYQDIAAGHQRIISPGSWEAEVKGPVHFNKEKSGIILELLALQKLLQGINDKNLKAAAATLAIAFSSLYKNKNGDIINKYNFRVHDLLIITIALNNSIADTKKWDVFRSATGMIDYSAENKLPARMNWMKSKPDFDKQVTYILNNRTKYTDRLTKRVADYKL